MCGPSINWKFYDELVKQRHEMVLHQLINIGSCGLHIIHGAFIIVFVNWKKKLRDKIKRLLQILHFNQLS